MGRVIVRNLRRASQFVPAKLPRCPICRVKRPYHGLLPGAHDPASLKADQFLSGVCSWACLAIYYGLAVAGPTEEIRALERACWCGQPVRTAGADCLDCQQIGKPIESGEFVHLEEWTGALETAGGID